MDVQCYSGSQDPLYYMAYFSFSKDEGRFHVNCSIKSEKQENKDIIDAFVEWDIQMLTACSVLCDFPPTCPSPAHNSAGSG